MGERSITPMGHVRMMAAAQPFISGAISKTVNMPEEATVEEIEEVYFQGWKIGLKALAIYRDNCKVGQPLSDGKAKRRGRRGRGRGAAGVASTARCASGCRRAARRHHVVQGGWRRGLHDRRVLPRRRSRRDVPEARKQGSTLAGVMDAFSIAISIALQYGVPLETYVSKFVNMRFEPAGLPTTRTSGWRSRSWTTSSVGWRWTTCPTRSAPRSASTPPRSVPTVDTGSYEPAPTTPEDDVGGLAHRSRWRGPGPRAVGPGRGSTPPAVAAGRPGDGALLGGAARDHHRQRRTHRCA